MEPLKDEVLKFYTGIRFIHGGNDLSGADCFGIIRLVNKREYGIDIGDYARSHPLSAFKHIDAFYKKITEDKLWLPLEKAYQGCVVVTYTLVNGKPYADHVGIYVDHNKILSTTLVDKFSNISSLENKLILGFYEFNTEYKL